tara:strand:+ start:6481 stop:7584 length:1104 start_codon:yes stop_codon:yes gene_type:complete
LDSASRYLSLDEPDRSDHLWRYTPWRRVHPSGIVSEIPELGQPILRLLTIDGSDVPDGIRLVEGEASQTVLPNSDELTSSFLLASSNCSRWTLVVDRKFSAESPIVLEIQTGEGASACQISLEVGEMAEIELVTRVVGNNDWFGLLRTGRIGDGAILNDVLLGLQERGTMLRSDSIAIGRDSQVRAGTVSSGSEKTKSDIRYLMGDSGGSVRVLGSILSADSMHLDHHIEIHHDAPETFSRLSWHSACGGKSRTVGTGMLRVSDGSNGADAAQIFHNLLLSKDAEADSIPELEVMEHDVVGCGHGTANGPIDEDQMFYLEARGLDKQDAKRALIAAFLNSTLSEMGSEQLHEWLVGVLSQQLESLGS